MQTYRILLGVVAMARGRLMSRVRADRLPPSGWNLRVAMCGFYLANVSK